MVIIVVLFVLYRAVAHLGLAVQVLASLFFSRLPVHVYCVISFADFFHPLSIIHIILYSESESFVHITRV